MRTLISRTPRLSFDEISQSVAFLNRVGQEKDLEHRKLGVEEIRRVIRFITAVKGGQIPRLVPGNALTLLRLTPALLEAKSSFTVHDAIMLGAPVAKDLYDKAPAGSAEKNQYHSILLTAGRACFDKRLTATTENRRLDEFALFKPLMETTSEYRAAMSRFKVHHQIGLKNREML